jgi:hypothetical protein
MAVRIALSIRASVKDVGSLACSALMQTAKGAVMQEYGYHDSEDPNGGRDGDPAVVARGELAREPAERATSDVQRAEDAMQAELVREIFGNPFRPVRVQTSWLSWINGPIRRMALLIYRERRFSDLPILADALEDVGCTEAALLDHLRSLGSHVRGCHAVDLLLRRE